jgi:predicted dehydrogenase
MSTRKFRVGIIGSGSIAQVVHIPGWKALPDVEIAAIADIDPAAARKAAEQVGPQVKLFTDYREMLKLGLDAVDICTPNQVHAPAALAALDSGCHVLCEKPLTVTAAGVRRMGERAVRKRRILMTAQNHRFRAEAEAMKAWVRAGNLGEVYHARVRAMRRAWLPPRAGFIDHRLSGGGPCMDIGVHALDAALWFMGFPKPVRVSGTSKVNFAKGRRIPGKWGDWDRRLYSVEDFAAGFVHFDNGATMILEASWLGHQKEDEDFGLELFGTGANVRWPSGEFSGVTAGVFTDGKISSHRRVESAYAEEIAAFHRAATGGGPSPVPWTETLRVIAILEAIYKSQETGREIRLR